MSDLIDSLDGGREGYGDPGDADRKWSPGNTGPIHIPQNGDVEPNSQILRDRGLFWCR